ncbi:MAG: hypothetical protein H0X01_11010, partial [Nitrospira sp.]|nr:hypothetical protein [Nitrospira sp.]
LVQATGRALDAGNGDEVLRLSLPYLLETAAKVVVENPSEDPLWHARVGDAGMMTLGTNARKRFYEQLGGA